MPNIQISQLPAAGPITGTELVPIVQNGLTVQTNTLAIAASPNLTQTFLTVNQEPTLTNSRSLAGNNGITLIDGGAQGSMSVQLTGAALAFQNAGAGIIAKTTTSTVASRAITASGSGLLITNGSGVAGDPTIALSGRAAAFANLGGSSGLVALSGAGATAVDILGVAGEIDVANGSGPSNPTIGIADNAVFPGTGGVVVPLGTVAQQPVGTSGQLRFNTDTQTFDGFSAGSWRQFTTGGGVTTFSGGTTGLTPASPTSGAVTLGGILNVPSGGSGASTLTGYLVGNGASPFTAVATIPNAGLTNSSITINGSNVSLGGSVTVTATASNPLTIGTGLSGASYNGSTPVTIAIDSTVATLTGAQTLTNKSISGATNTLTAIPNGALTNSSVTFNGTAVALGGSGTITATATNALTIGTGLTGTSYNGSTPVTVTIDSSVATLTGSQTLTNKSMSGASNTFTSIPNGALSNSTISGVALGSNLFALTIGTGLTGTSYNGSGAVTVGIDSTVATLSGIQTLANKSISGSTNTLSNIANSALTNSSVTLGSTSVALGATSLTLAGLTSVTVTQPPVSALQLATKQYVDDAVSTGITIHSPVRVETPTALNATYLAGGTAVTVTDITGGTTLTFSTSPSLSVNDQIVFASTANGIVAGTAYYVYSVPAANQVTLSLTYNGPEITTFTNGTGLTIAGTVNAGVGATLTNAGVKAALQVDGVTLSVSNRVLVYNQASAFQNGVYTVTTVGTPDPGGTNWVLTRSSDANTYKPDSINGLGQGDYFFVQEGVTGAGESYVMTTNNPIIIGTTGLTFTQFSSSQVYAAGTGLTLTGTTFSITNTGVAAASYGTASSVPTIAINAQGQITSASNTSIAIDGNQITSGTVGSAYLSGSYTGITGVGTLTAGTWNATTIGVAYGGTGITSYVIGDLLYASGTTTISKLPIGASSFVMTSTGSAPAWSNQSSLSVGSATNAANTAIALDATNADYFITVVSASTGNLPQKVASGLTANPSTGKITGGIAGGTF